jgi:8-oxo-dGTP diphosphatase
MLRLAGCVLLDDQKKILLLHRNKGGLIQWELPGGKIDEGEDAVTTAVREIQEELGVDVEISRELGSAEFEAPDTMCHYSWFLAEIRDEDKPHIGEPQTFDDMRYFSVEELSMVPLSSNMANLLRAIQAGDVDLSA